MFVLQFSVSLDVFENGICDIIKGNESDFAIIILILSYIG